MRVRALLCGLEGAGNRDESDVRHTPNGDDADEDMKASWEEA